MSKEELRNIKISDLIGKYPYLAEMLQYEWGFHCVNCIISGFETLEQGASIHGIEGEDFDMMMDMIIQYIKLEEVETNSINDNQRKTNIPKNNI